MSSIKRLLLAGLLIGILAILFLNYTFIKGLVMHSEQVGACFPCSGYTAQKVCSFIDHDKGPLEILEVGSGTGALTNEIIKRLGEDDHLDLVELLPEFCETLKPLVTQNVNLFCGSILDWKPNRKYDIIICSLPFNTFKPSFVQELLDHLKSLAKLGCIFTYVELMWVTTLKSFFLTGNKKDELAKTRALMNELRTQKGIRTDNVYLNVTPIYVHHIGF